MSGWISMMRAVARDCERMEKQRAREAQKAERERQKILRAQEREQLKLDKQAYIQKQLDKAEIMSTEVIERYNRYNTIVNKVYDNKATNIFENMKESFSEEPFLFDIPEPAFIEPTLHEVPEVSWIDRFSKKRRAKIEEIEKQNQVSMDNAKKEYEENCAKYESDKNRAYEEWRGLQDQRRTEFFESIESEKNLYLAGDLEALKAYFDALMSFSHFSFDAIDNYNFGYQANTKKLVIEIEVKNRDVLFSVGGYRYLKQKDEFVTTKMKVSDATTCMRTLMIDLAIAAMATYFKNDLAGAISSISVNIYHNGICCVSVDEDRQIFEQYDLRVTSQKYEFMGNHMRIFKTLTTGVKPFEYIYHD